MVNPSSPRTKGGWRKKDFLTEMSSAMRAMPTTAPRICWTMKWNDWPYLSRAMKLEELKTKKTPSPTRMRVAARSGRSKATRRRPIIGGPLSSSARRPGGGPRP